MRVSLYPSKYHAGRGIIALLLPWQLWSTLPAAAAEANETVLVTARLRPENEQTVPISMSVVSGNTLEATGTSNVSQLTQLVPTLNYVSPNPRNTALMIRGLGSSVVAVAQANDGLEPGVGFYVDQVYHARPATAAFDFLDLERIEVLRGPQGTLFGKNTTAGAMNITTRAPTFGREFMGEVSGGEYGYFQARMTASAPLVGNVLAGRISIVSTLRDDLLKNVTTHKGDNDLNNHAARAQLLYRPREDFSLRVTADFEAIDTNCCTQVFFKVGRTLKPASRQFESLAAASRYTPPSRNAYDRITDIDVPIGVMSHEGGVSAIADWRLSEVTLSSISAWRYWQWDAANDRDFTGVPIQTIQGIPSRQDQYSQELRVASNGIRRLDYTGGLYFFTQTIKGHPVTQYGSAAALWLLGRPPGTPSNLLDGYRTEGDTRFSSYSYAAFGEATWHVLERVDVTGGVRYTAEDKDGRFDADVSGGLATTNPALIAKKLSILRPQSYRAAVSDGSVSGRVGLSWRWTDQVMPYVSWALGNKSGGINMSGLPLTANNQPALATATVKPEQNTTVELGIKSRWLNNRVLFNADVFDTLVHDFQANVVDTAPGALRGYLANIDKVRVRGAEFDATLVLNEHFSGHLSTAWTDGAYRHYRNGPCPLERIGLVTAVCDLSGRPLPQVPRWAISAGGEYTSPVRIGSFVGERYVRADFTVRTKVFGEPSDSNFAVIDGYGLLNLTFGLRQAGPWEVALWVRNVLDEHYLQNLTVQAGNSGLIVGTPGDPRTFGVTLRATF